MKRLPPVLPRICAAIRNLGFLPALTLAVGLLTALPAAAQTAFDEFDIDGKTYAVPAPVGLCKVTDDDLQNTGLKSLVLGSISRTLDIRSVRMTCDMRADIREGRQPKNGRIHMVAFVRLGGESTILDQASLSQFNMFKSIFGFPPDHPARRALEIGLLNALNKQGTGGAGCTAIESNDSALGGELCLERARGDRALRLDMAAAANPIDNRLVIVLIINANLPSEDRPRFDEAARALGQIQPSISQ